MGVWRQLLGLLDRPAQYAVDVARVPIDPPVTVEVEEYIYPIPTNVGDWVVGLLVGDDATAFTHRHAMIMIAVYTTNDVVIAISQEKRAE